MLSLIISKLSHGAHLTLLRMIVSTLIRYCKKLFGGFMFKLLFMGVLVSMLSNITGVPVSPVYPIIHNQSLKFETTSIDQNKYKNFKKYIVSKF